MMLKPGQLLMSGEGLAVEAHVATPLVLAALPVVALNPLIF